MAVLVIVALVLACLGAGRTVLGSGGGGARLGLDGIAGLTGLALLTGLAGWLVLAGAYSATAGWVLLALGSGALMADLVRTRTRPSGAQRASGNVPVGALAIGLLSLTLVVGRSLGEFAVPIINFNDDQPAYWVFPRLLLESGGFIEPFNIRRLITLGATPFLQSFFWKDFSIAAPGIADTLLGQLVIWAAARTVPNALSTRPQPAWRGEALALAALLVSLALTRANAMPTLLPMGGALVLMLLTRRVTEADTFSNGIRAVLPWGLAWGLVAAWLIGLRISNALFPVGLWIVGALVAGLRRERQQGLRLAVAALATLGGLLPWSLALWRSSGTPLFPLIRGNYSLENSPPLPADFAGILGFAGDCLWTNHVWVVVAIGAVAALRPAVRLLSIQVISALVLLVTVTAVMANGGQAVDSLSVHRYSAPFLVAGLVILAGSLLVTEPGATFRRLRLLLPGAGLALWLLIPVDLRFSMEEQRYRITNLGLIHRSAVQSAGAAAGAWVSGLRVRELPGRASYEAAQARLPAHARLISATDAPFLFRFDTQTIHTLDIPGLVSPPPGMPAFEGPERIAAYFRDLGYTHLAFTPPQAATGLYSPGQWLKLNEQGTLQEKNWARHVLMFLQNEERLEQSYPVTYQSLELVVIDLRRPK